MNKLKYKLVQGKSERQRFYRVNFKVNKFECFGKISDTKKAYKEYVNDCIKEEFKDIYLKNITYDVICISDALTHNERLVFLGMYDYRHKKYVWLNVQVGGEHTGMYYYFEGDEEKIKEDSYYILELYKIQKENNNE